MELRRTTTSKGLRRKVMSVELVAPPGPPSPPLGVGPLTPPTPTPDGCQPPPLTPAGR